jgi:hypothetical protein
MLNITFTESGAGFLRQALWDMGLKQRVVTLPDDLSVGPIVRLDPDERYAWREENLRPPDYFAGEKVAALPLADEVEDFWSLALAADSCTVWFTRRVPGEYCGFLGWMELAGDRTYNVVDVTDVRSRTDGRLIFSIAGVNHSDVDYEGLVAGACPLMPEAIAAYESQWKTLKDENAALRVLANGELVSAPIDFFDDLLLSRVDQDWQKAMRIVGEAWIAATDKQSQPVEPEVLLARLVTLVDTGRMEASGDFDNWWTSVEVRQIST